MQRGIFAAALALLIAMTANASDQSCTRDTLRPASVAATRIDVAALFERRVVAADGTTRTEPIEGMEVLIARIGTDGKPVLACVDSAAAAKRFLEAPVDKLATAAKEK